MFFIVWKFAAIKEEKLSCRHETEQASNIYIHFESNYLVALPCSTIYIETKEAVVKMWQPQFHISAPTFAKPLKAIYFRKTYFNLERGCVC